MKLPRHCSSLDSYAAAFFFVYELNQIAAAYLQKASLAESKLERIQEVWLDEQPAKQVLQRWRDQYSDEDKLVVDVEIDPESISARPAVNLVMPTPSFRAPSNAT